MQFEARHVVAHQQHISDARRTLSHFLTPSLSHTLTQTQNYATLIMDLHFLHLHFPLLVLVHICTHTTSFVHFVVKFMCNADDTYNLSNEWKNEEFCGPRIYSFPLHMVW